MSLGRAQILKVFLGDFFAPAKKLPALMRGSSFSKTKEGALDSRFRGNDEQGQKRNAKALDSGLTRFAVMKLFAGMTSGGKNENQSHWIPA
jgi:hypothetical protein